MVCDHQWDCDADVAVEDGTRIVIVWDETIDARPAAPLFASVRYLDPSPRETTCEATHEVDKLVIEVSTKRPAAPSSMSTRARRNARSSRVAA